MTAQKSKHCEFVKKMAQREVEAEESMAEHFKLEVLDLRERLGEKHKKNLEKQSGK